MSWQTARLVSDVSVSADTDYAGTSPPTVPTSDIIEIPRSMQGKTVVGIEIYFFLLDSGSPVGRGTLTVDISLLDIDSIGGTQVPAESAAITGIPPWTRAAFDATTGTRNIYFRIDATAGAAAASFTDYGIRYREVLG